MTFRRLLSTTTKLMATTAARPVVKAAVVTAATTAVAAKVIRPRWQDTIQGTSEFAQHTKKELRAHRFSGMHAPFRTKDPELQALFKEHFSSEFAHLFPEVEELKERQARETPVKIRPLADSPVPFDAKSSVALGVGGPPALISLAQHKAPTYINDEAGWPIINGSAFHLEFDRPTEEPSRRHPTEFMLTQIQRAINYHSFADIEKTGQFAWSSLDWEGWLKNPGQWFTGAKVFANVQKAALATPEKRQQIVDDVIENCRFNQKFYEQLNERFGGKLLLKGEGSIYMSRTPEEVADAKALANELAKDGQHLEVLTKEQHIAEYGYAPEGMLHFARKGHDRVLSPNFKKIITDEIKQQGGNVINGKVTQIFITGKEAVVEYQTPNGENHYISSHKILMSLGKQNVLDAKNKPLFDTVAARGASSLALAFAPVDCKKHPPVGVYGGTNHVTCLSGPVEVVRNGKPCKMFLLRMTSGAAITPGHSGVDSARYDGSIGFGVFSAVEKSLAGWEVAPIAVSGCNRSISSNMYSKWQAPHDALKLQFGAGGGGATNAPLGAKEATEEASLSSTPRFK